MIDLYVYYKVRSEDAGELAPRVRAMQLALAGAGSGALLQRRPETRDAVLTTRTACRPGWKSIRASTRPSARASNRPSWMPASPA